MNFTKPMDAHMPPHDYSTPVWSHPQTTPRAPCPLEAHEEVDLAVVGGGFLGLSAALHAARHGLSVRILEARAIGQGASGLNGGQVIPGLKYDPEWLLQHFGTTRGEALISFVSSTADSVFNLIRDETMDVPHRRDGWIQAAHTQTAMTAAADRDRQWRARGADVSLLNASEIALLTGTQGYLGGWLDRRAGTINPLAFVLELARIAENAGVRIAEQTRVTGLRKEGSNWRLVSQSGSELVAKSVIVATNAYSDTLLPGLAETLVPLHSFQVATAPLSADLLASVLPHGQAVSDSRRILNYYRLSPDGRFVLGGRGRMSEPESDGDWAHLERSIVRLYPQLRGVPIERRWFGRVAVTPDHLPHLHEPDKGLLTLVGCQGRGVGLMTAMGRHFADYLKSGDRAALPFPITPIKPIPFHSLRRIGVAAAIAWYRMLDAVER